MKSSYLIIAVILMATFWDIYSNNLEGSLNQLTMSLNGLAEVLIPQTTRATSKGAKSVFITEIINDTDRFAYINLLRHPSIPLSSFYRAPFLKKSIFLETQREESYLKMDSQWIIFDPKSKNYLADLKLQSINPSIYDPTANLFHVFDQNYVYVNFIPDNAEKYRPPSSEKNPLVGMRLVGDLLEVSSGKNIDARILVNLKVYVDGNEITTNKILKKIDDNATYTIEIQPDVIKIRKNNIKNDTSAIRQTVAYIEKFETDNNTGLTKATVKFRNLYSREYLAGFIRFMESKKELQRIATITPIPIFTKLTPSESIVFSFYADITRHEFQSMLDAANRENFEPLLRK